jgi:antitoxin PrlF
MSLPLDGKMHQFYYKVRNFVLGKTRCKEVLVMPTARLSSKGQTVIPKEVREDLKLHPGDRVDFVLQESGEYVLRPVRSDLQALRGMLHDPQRRPVPLEAMDRAIRQRGGKTP